MFKLFLRNLNHRSISTLLLHCIVSGSKISNVEIDTSWVDVIFLKRKDLKAKDNLQLATTNNKSWCNQGLPCVSAGRLHCGKEIPVYPLIKRCNTAHKSEQHWPGSLPITHHEPSEASETTTLRLIPMPISFQAKSRPDPGHWRRFSSQLRINNHENQIITEELRLTDDLLCNFHFDVSALVALALRFACQYFLGWWQYSWRWYDESFDSENRLVVAN